MTPAQRQRQKTEHRDRGRYAKVNPCYVCDKSAGVNYFSHPDTDNTIDDELLCLCRECADRLSGLPGPEAVALAFPAQSTHQEKPS